MIDSEKSDKDFGYDSIGDGEPDTHPTNSRLRESYFYARVQHYECRPNPCHILPVLHPECQQRLYEELKTCDEFTYEKLVHLKYLNAVISETQRLSPSLTRIQRMCLKDFKLGNTEII
ncbi:unnamed protein product [Oppiella nova]|uniref:Uncharacterized protein n=1 Tax=Oppiella nova TaxID=334625 RepID=A0A7R9QT10_9ACAR|nr:unnamed protein product [Oppiella nova]CAG2173866.1 unnamed protein product [Oppiella nova]